MSIVLDGTSGITTPALENAGVTTVAAGSVSAPAITTDGDTNTGIFFPAADTIAFAEGGAESMRIDSDGKLLIGRTSSLGTTAGGLLEVETAAVAPAAGFANNSAGGKYTLSLWNKAASSQRMVVFWTGSGQTYAGGIECSGANTYYYSASDYRLKENIAPMTGALAKVAALKPVTYTWKADGSVGEGFIAHELQAVVPACVSGSKDALDDEGNPAYQGIDTSFLVATLTSAIQEQQAIIESLTARVAALEQA